MQMVLHQPQDSFPAQFLQMLQGTATALRVLWLLQHMHECISIKLFQCNLLHSTAPQKSIFVGNITCVDCESLICSGAYRQLEQRPDLAEGLT